MAALLAGAELVARIAVHRPFGTLNRVCGPHLECLPVTPDRLGLRVCHWGSQTTSWWSSPHLLTFSSRWGRKEGVLTFCCRPGLKLRGFPHMSVKSEAQCCEFFSVCPARWQSCGPTPVALLSPPPTPSWTTCLRAGFARWYGPESKEFVFFSSSFQWLTSRSLAMPSREHLGREWMSR